MAKARKDNKGRALRKGEVQRSQDGRYVYTYTNPVGKRCYIYANTLMELREKEDELKLLKSEMAVLERKIRLELVPLEKNMEKGETDMKQKQSPQILLSSIDPPEQPSSQHALVERSVSQTKSFRL